MKKRRGFWVWFLLVSVLAAAIFWVSWRNLPNSEYVDFPKQFSSGEDLGYIVSQLENAGFDVEIFEYSNKELTLNGQLWPPPQSMMSNQETVDEICGSMCTIVKSTLIQEPQYFAWYMVHRFDFLWIFIDSQLVEVIDHNSLYRGNL